MNRMITKLGQNLIAAWELQAMKAAAFLRAAHIAPALFKPDAVEQARRDYATALHKSEVGL